MPLTQCPSATAVPFLLQASSVMHVRKQSSRSSVCHGKQTSCYLETNFDGSSMQSGQGSQAQHVQTTKHAGRGTTPLHKEVQNLTSWVITKTIELHHMLLRHSLLTRVRQLAGVLMLGPTPTSDNSERSLHCQEIVATTTTWHRSAVPCTRPGRFGFASVTKARVSAPYMLIVSLLIAISKSLSLPSNKAERLGPPCTQSHTSETLTLFISCKRGFPLS